MGAQCLAQHRTYRRAAYCDALDRNKMGFFARGNFLASDRSGRSPCPAESISPCSDLWLKARREQGDLTQYPLALGILSEMGIYRQLWFRTRRARRRDSQCRSTQVVPNGP